MYCMSTIKFKATPKQYQALQYLNDDITTSLWYWWAAWWGKSYLWVFWVWQQCQRYPNTTWFFWRKERVNLLRTTFASYNKFLRDYNVPENNRWVFKEKDSVILFSNWSKILLLDLARQPSDPLYTRFWSLELTGWFVDESNEVDAACIEILSTRVGRQMNMEYSLKPKILETFNPDHGHVYSRFYKPFKDGTMPEYRKFIPALVGDNSYQNPDYQVQLSRVDNPITVQRLLYGNFEYDDNPAKLFRWDEISDMFSNIITERKDMYITCDPARLGKDTTRIIVWKWYETVEIKTLHQQTTDVVAFEIRDLEKKYRVHRYNICIDSDGVWWWVADQLRGCVQFVNNSTPISVDPDKSQFANLHNQSSFANLKTQCYFVLKYFLEKRLIKINASWEDRSDLEQELDNITIDKPDSDTKIKLESKDKMKDRIGRSPDLADAIMMRMIFPLRNWEDIYNPQRAIDDNYEEETMIEVEMDDYLL